MEINLYVLLLVLMPAVLMLVLGRNMVKTLLRELMRKD